MVNITQTQIEALIDEKGNARKCPKCIGITFVVVMGEKVYCKTCQGTGKSTITIPKEWVEDLGSRLNEKNPEMSKVWIKKIPKYKVGQEIIPELCGNRQLSKSGFCMDCGEYHKLKIISETETHWRVCLG